MADAHMTKSVKVTLILNENEAKYLRGMLQNYLGGDNPSDEPVNEHEMRSTIWDCLNDALGEC